MFLFQRGKQEVLRGEPFVYLLFIYYLLILSKLLLFGVQLFLVAVKLSILTISVSATIQIMPIHGILLEEKLSPTLDLEQQAG